MKSIFCLKATNGLIIIQIVQIPDWRTATLVKSVFSSLMYVAIYNRFFVILGF